MGTLLTFLKQEDGSIIYNKKKYVPSGDVAREFGYALGHVAFLARENKINAVWAGKRWYINRDSVLKYKKIALKNKILGGIKSQNIIFRDENKTKTRTIKTDSLDSQEKKYLLKKSDFLRISLIIFLIIFGISQSGILPISANKDLIKSDLESGRALIGGLSENIRRSVSHRVALFFNMFLVWLLDQRDLVVKGVDQTSADILKLKGNIYDFERGAENEIASIGSTIGTGINNTIGYLSVLTYKYVNKYLNLLIFWLVFVATLVLDFINLLVQLLIQPIKGVVFYSVRLGKVILGASNHLFDSIDFAAASFWRSYVCRP